MLTKAAIALALTAALTPMAIAMESLTYKGTLSENDKPANGSYEMQLQLFTEEFGGSQLGFAITLPNVQVKDGSFQVPIDLPHPLPAEQSVWLQAQIKPTDSSDFYLLDGRQEIKSTAGGACWETTGNATLNGGIIGIPGSPPGSLLSLTNRGSSIFLRAGGGVEQSASVAAGARAAAFNSSTAAGSDSFTIGRGVTGAAHSFSTVFVDGVAGAFSSTAANQFLIRAQNGVGINTNAPLGTFSVRRGGSSGAASASASVITGESDTNTYLTLLTPANQERGVLFGDPSNVASGGVLYNTAANPNGMTLRTGGNFDRLRLSAGGKLLLNAPGVSLDTAADVVLRSPDIGAFRLDTVPNTGTGFRIDVGDGTFQVTPTFAGTSRFESVFGILRTPVTNALEVQGNASKTTAGDWLANSDRRIKRDIEPIDNALALINRLQPVTFRYTDAYRNANRDIVDQRYYNVIAQDFAEVFPDAVKSSGDYLPGVAKTKANEILQVDTYPATITAIAAIQELDVKASLTDERVAKLQAENAELRARLAAIERLLDTATSSVR